MRRTIIGIGLIMAALQLWPSVTGRENGFDTASAATISAGKPAGGAQVSRPVAAASTGSERLPLLNCSAQFHRVVAVCTPGDGACQARVIDQYDICESRGIWPI